MTEKTKEEKRITIKDISKKLGISAATVTNALNDKPNVSEALRKKIKEEAKAMGYKPNIMARVMAKNGIKLALLVAEEPQEFLSGFHRGVDDQIKLYSDYKVSLDKYTYRDVRANDEAGDVLRTITNIKYDGVIFYPTFAKEKHLKVLEKYLEEVKAPALLMNMDYKSPRNLGMVSVDSTVQGKLAAQYIHQVFGSCKVGVITTSREFQVHAELVDSFKEECGRLKIEIVDILENQDDKTLTYECTAKLVTEHPDIKVIYQTSYDSVHVCKCLQNKGIKNVKVIAHDVYEGMIPYMEDGIQIATIFQNPYDTGRIAIKKLVDAIIGEPVYNQITKIRPELVLEATARTYLRRDDSVQEGSVIQ